MKTENPQNLASVRPDDVHPVYPMHPHDFDGSAEIAGWAATEAEAAIALRAFYEGTGYEAAPRPWLTDREWHGKFIWAWWDRSAAT